MIPAPEVRYATASDGVRVAYTAFGGGAGVPLVVLRSLLTSHLQARPSGSYRRRRSSTSSSAWHATGSSSASTHAAPGSRIVTWRIGPFLRVPPISAS